MGFFILDEASDKSKGTKGINARAEKRSGGGLNNQSMDQIDNAINNFAKVTQAQNQQMAAVKQKKQQKAAQPKAGFYQPQQPAQQQPMQQVPVVQPQPAPQPMPAPAPQPMPQPVQPVAQPAPAPQPGFYQPQQQQPVQQQPQQYQMGRTF